MCGRTTVSRAILSKLNTTIVNFKFVFAPKRAPQCGAARRGGGGRYPDKKQKYTKPALFHTHAVIPCKIIQMSTISKGDPFCHPIMFIDELITVYHWSSSTRSSCSGTCRCVGIQSYVVMRQTYARSYFTYKLVTFSYPVRIH